MTSNEKKIQEQDLNVILCEWLEKYHSSEDKYKRAKYQALIVDKMLPIVRKIARRIARRAYDPVDDLAQAGAIGLLKAIDRYSKEKNDNFRIFAGYYIIGEIKHYLRDKLHTIRVPRTIHELSYRINSFIQTLTIDELDELTNDDVAEALHVSAKYIDIARDLDRRRETVSLDELFHSEEQNRNFEEIFAKEDYKETKNYEDARIIINEVIELLPNEYREIVDLYYFQGLNQVDIASIKKTSKMNVSRKMKKAFAILYRLIAEKTNEV